ncbi:MAG: hypothetical protein ACLTSX_05225 [Collinsella sp.]
MADQAWRVLIVDDEPPIRAELNYLLKQDGRVGRIEEAGGATEAVERFWPLAPRCCSSTFRCPARDGVQLADTPAKVEEAPVIVFVTAFSGVCGRGVRSSTRRTTCSSRLSRTDLRRRSTRSRTPSTPAGRR